MPYISIKEVSYNFENTNNLFKNISLNIKPKEKIALIGDNGIGKKTLFNLILNNKKCSSGNINIKVTISNIQKNFN